MHANDHKDESQWCGFSLASKCAYRSALRKSTEFHQLFSHVWSFILKGSLIYSKKFSKIQKCWWRFSRMSASFTEIFRNCKNQNLLDSFITFRSVTSVPSRTASSEIEWRSWAVLADSPSGRRELWSESCRLFRSGTFETVSQISWDFAKKIFDFFRKYVFEK